MSAVPGDNFSRVDAVQLDALEKSMAADLAARRAESCAWFDSLAMKQRAQFATLRRRLSIGAFGYLIDNGD